MSEKRVDGMMEVTDRQRDHKKKKLKGEALA
jgi:hypothetical protein